LILLRVVATENTEGGSGQALRGGDRNGQRREEEKAKWMRNDEEGDGSVEMEGKLARLVLFLLFFLFPLSFFFPSVFVNFSFSFFCWIACFVFAATFCLNSFPSRFSFKKKKKKSWRKPMEKKNRKKE